MIPLYYSVSSGLSASYDMGVLEGLGTTTVSENNGVKTLTYSFHGPINYEKYIGNNPEFGSDRDQ